MPTPKMYERAPFWVELSGSNGLYTATIPQGFVMHGLGIKGVHDGSLVEVLFGDKPFISPAVPAMPFVSAYRVIETTGTFPYLFSRSGMIPPGAVLTVRIDAEPAAVMAWGLLSRVVG